MSKDWYRRKSWTEVDQEEFFIRLKRARANNRPQYLRVQALELAETAKPELLNAAEQLLHKLLLEYPDNTLEKSPSLHVLGTIYKQRKDFETALEYFKQAIDFEKLYPNVKTQAYLDFSDLVVKLEKSEHFDFVEQLINERVESLLFPVEKHHAYSILAVISNRRGDMLNIERYKALAEVYAAQNTSGMRYHPKVGLVKKRHRWLDSLLRRNTL